MGAWSTIASVPLNALLVVGAGSVVGFLAGLFGVGASCLLAPALAMAGMPAVVAVVNDGNEAVAASLSGLLAHKKVGHVDWKLGALIVTGGLGGVVVGNGLAPYVAYGICQLVLRLGYFVMMLAAGGMMIQESLRAMAGRGAGTRGKGPRWLARLPGKTGFPVSGVEFPGYALVALGFLVGLLSALMGVGAGFLMLPVLIYLVGVPTAVAVGTNLVMAFFTSLPALVAQPWTNGTVDLLAVLAMLVSSAAAAQVGASVCACLKMEKLRFIYALVIIGMVALLLRDLLLPPAGLIMVAGGP